MSMFCYQCQETARNTACTVKGVCGKDAEVAALQDLLLHLLKGLSYYGVRARKLGVSDPEADTFVTEALFATITNADFDRERFGAWVRQALQLRDRLAERAQQAGATFEQPPAAATWQPAEGDLPELVAQGYLVGVQSDPTLNEDIRSLRELIVYGLKGLAAYTHHAYALDARDDEILAFQQQALDAVNDPAVGADALVPLAMQVGKMGVRAMALLDGANTGHYGNPQPTAVNTGVKPGPAILVSGHDLRDLEELLRQTEGKGINIYTHGEMLPAHGYPELKKHAHLVGNYGGSWWHQQNEFEKFGGAILMTTNCLVEPRASYKGRLFTTGVAGWSGVAHFADREPGKEKDFSAVIACALNAGSPQELEQGTVMTGFGHAALAGAADAIVAGVKSGAIKRFVVMAGCDGRQRSREYFTDVAQGLPADSIILTAGCAKYRYNKLDLGTIGGIPRVVDAGQCNDSYSLVVTALKLAEVFGVESVNDLPIAYDIGWYEQKAVLVLLALLSLGVKKIRLGPTLPAFLTPNVAKVIVDTFDLRPTTTVEQDLESIVAGK